MRSALISRNRLTHAAPPRRRGQPSRGINELKNELESTTLIGSDFSARRDAAGRDMAIKIPHFNAVCAVLTRIIVYALIVILAIISVSAFSISGVCCAGMLALEACWHCSIATRRRRTKICTFNRK